MRGTVTAHLTDGPYAGAFVQVEAVDGRPASVVYFAVVEGRVRPMPRGDVDKATLDAAAGKWKPYGRDELTEDVWRYRSLRGRPCSPGATGSR
jgi:hypothetical protein